MESVMMRQCWLEVFVFTVVVSLSRPGPALKHFHHFIHSQEAFARPPLALSKTDWLSSSFYFYYSIYVYSLFLINLTTSTFDLNLVL